MPAKIIFISIDGMTDPLGQSQVLPYLSGLSALGFEISIVSCEKESNFLKNRRAIEELVAGNNISWNYCFYENKIPLISQKKNFSQLKKLTTKKLKEKGLNCILHCRSYLPGLIGLDLKKRFGTKFIFDMRGFWADERLDGHIWKINNPLHYFLYNYFKQKEKQMLKGADHIVTLSQVAKNIISSWHPEKNNFIEVIPCCVDINHFKIRSSGEKSLTRKSLNIPADSFVAGYLGSLGTWYMLNEMLDLFIELKKKKTNALFFFVTPDDEKEILDAAAKKNIPASSILVRSAKRNEVPEYISTFDLGIFFIRPSFSKKASSPTKLAELLACGIPVLTNSGIGDCDAVINENNCGLIIEYFSEESYTKAVAGIDTLLIKPAEHFRSVAISNFSLEKGIASYEKIYLSLSEGLK